MLTYYCYSRGTQPGIDSGRERGRRAWAGRGGKLGETSLHYSLFPLMFALIHILLFYRRF